MAYKLLTFLGAGVLAAALSIPSRALAADEHHGGSLDAREHGYEHGYRDGYTAGIDAKEHGNRVKTGDIDTDHDYRSSFGSKDAYREGYREGYRTGADDAFNGSRAGLEKLFGFRDPNFDPDRPGADAAILIYRERNWDTGDIASDIGYRDGINAGLRDFRNGHKFKPEDHDAYKDADHGYDSKYGPK